MYTQLDTSPTITMARSGHLQQTDLSAEFGDKEVDELKDFGLWAVKKKYRVVKEVQGKAVLLICVDEGKNAKINSIRGSLVCLIHASQRSQLSRSQKDTSSIFQHLFLVPGPDPVKLLDAPGLAYVYPIHIPDGESPTITDSEGRSKILEVGRMTEIREPSIVSSTVYLFVLVMPNPHQRSGSKDSGEGSKDSGDGGKDSGDAQVD
jgi:hypothetical protein